MNYLALRRWAARRFFPLSGLDYIAVVAAAVGLCDEIVRWCSEVALSP